MKPSCSHLDRIRDVQPPERLACADCEKSGDSWVHLTQCLSCGYVGCCEDSKNRHAHHHFREQHHPLVRTLTAPEKHVWCYTDEIFVDQSQAA